MAIRKSVQKIKAEKGCSYPEARKIIQSTSTSSSGTSYAAAAKITFATTACQTDLTMIGAISKSNSPLCSGVDHPSPDVVDLHPESDELGDMEHDPTSGEDMEHDPPAGEN